MARATKSTGTMFVWPPSGPASGNHSGSAPELLEQLEEVVGTVDLVHLAGLRVADHDARPEHQRLRLHALAHQPLGLVLRAVVVVRQLLALVEHVLLEHALVVAGHRDRAGVVEAPDLVRVRELDHVLRALHVRAL